MPSRRRNRQPSAPTTRPPEATVDPVSQFGQLLRQAAEREAAAAQRAEQQREDARARRRAADAHAASLREARRELDHAIAGVRRARADRRDEVAADAAWRAAKARVIELETGAPPGWAPTDAAPDGTEGASAGEPPADEAQKSGADRA